MCVHQGVHLALPNIIALRSVQNTLEHPDERQLARGIKYTDVPAHLKSMVDSLVWESTRTEEGLVSFLSDHTHMT